MEMIEKIISEVLRMVTDKRYYYSMQRENEFAVDCSSLIIRSIEKYLPVNGASYTGNMINALVSTGNFKSLPFNLAKAQRGDIFVKHVSGSNGHAVIYLGNNRIAEACNKKNGLRECNYYFNSYQYMIRYIGEDAERMDDMPVLKKGDKNIYVGFVQLFLNKYCGCRLVIDCDFGPRTFEAIKGNFQAMHGLKCDGIIGVKSWSKIYFIMVTNS